MGSSWSPSKPAQTFGTLQNNPNPFQQQKKPAPPRPTTDSIEILKDIPKTVGNTLQEHAIQGTQKAVNEVLGFDLLAPKKGNLKPGEALDLKSLGKGPEQKPKAPIAAGIETPSYERGIVDAGKNALMKEKQQDRERIQELRAKIQQAATTNEAKQMVAQATGSTIEAPGKYHKGLLEGLLGLLNDMKQKAEDSNTWQNAGQGKKNQQGMLGAPQKQKSHQTFAQKLKQKFVGNEESKLAKSG